MKKTVSLVLAFVFILTVFSSCGYRLKWEKIEKDTTAPTDESTRPTVEISTYPDTLPPETTQDPLEQAGITMEKGFKLTGMDTRAVLDLYTKAVNNVKIRCPGFTRKEFQEISDVTAGNGNVNLANQIVGLVAHELVSASGNSNSVLTVAAHDDIKVRESFPVYGEEYGCKVSDLSIIKSATCLSDGKQYKVIITFNNQLNPEPKKCDFGNIMTPIERENIAKGMQTYVVVLDPDLFKFDFNYTGSELICYIDIESGKISSLTQKMQIDIDVDLDINVGFFKTDIVKANGSLVNHLEFTDFDWTV